MNLFLQRTFFKDNNALDYDDEDLIKNRESMIYDVYKRFGQKRNIAIKKDRDCLTEVRNENKKN